MVPQASPLACPSLENTGENHIMGLCTVSEAGRIAYFNFVSFFHRQQSMVWSFTIPVACMWA